MLERDKIYLGDCLELMKDMPDKSIDCVICDLPYGITDCEFDTIIPFDLLWEQYNRIIKPKGNIVLFASGRFVFQLYNSQPNKYRYDLIWKKTKCGSPLTAKYMPLKMHEHILIFGESASVYNPQMTYGGTPYKKDYNHAYGIKNAHGYGIKGYIRIITEKGIPYLYKSSSKNGEDKTNCILLKNLLNWYNGLLEVIPTRAIWFLTTVLEVALLPSPQYVRNDISSVWNSIKSITILPARE